MRALRVALVATAAAGAGLLVLIALNQARFGDVRLVRFRETTLAIEGALLLALVLGPGAGARIDRWRDRIERRLADPGFFRIALGITLALYGIASLTQHWAFRTGSHDFSMIDEALWHSHHGRFLWSPVLGRSFLTEHFSPILALLVPLHAIAPTPYLLVLLQPLALWAAALVLDALLGAEGVKPAVRHLVALLFLHHAVTISTLGYLFHMECFLPLALFALHLALRRGRWPAYAIALVLALAIKEDVGFYVAGYGIWLGVAERRWRPGLVTAAASLAWSLGATQFALPALGGGEGYAFLGRWDHWGSGIPGILGGFLAHPVELGAALLAEPYPAFFASLLFLPFVRWGALLLLAPWMLNATSALEPQRSLSLYYGMPLLACAAIATAAALRPGPARRFARGRWTLAWAALAVVLSFSHLSFPEIPRDRRAILGAIAALPDSGEVQLMWCFFPSAGYDRQKILLRPGESLTADHVVLWTRGSTWPFSATEAESLARSAIASGIYRNLSPTAEFYLLERRAGDAP